MQNEDRGTKRFAIGMGIFFSIGGILFLSGESGFSKFFAIVAFCCAAFYFYGAAKIERGEKEANEHATYAIEKLKTAEKSVKIPPNSSRICNGLFYLWRTTTAIHIFAADWKAEDFQEKVIEIDDIYFYSREGEVHTETSGYGGGSSYSIITGFHGKIDPVSISTTVKDSRKTVLIYKDRGHDCSLELAYEDYLVLKRILPEKDMVIVTSQQQAAALRQATDLQTLPAPKDTLSEKSSVKTVVEKDELELSKSELSKRLQTLKGLWEEDLITDEEYQRRKQKLLEEL